MRKKATFNKPSSPKPHSFVDPNGNKYWSLNGLRHREDGPAIEWADGSKFWFKNGHYHREDGPAIEYANGDKYWYKNGVLVSPQPVMTTDEYGNKFWKLDGKLHREDGPAIEWANGNKSWWKNGQCHREDGPACECADGDKEWYKNGQRHREDGPAVEWANGDKFWFKNGQCHREDGPAVELANGSKEWWTNGKRHREDGPACEWEDGDKEWYKNGQRHREDGPAVERTDGSKDWYKNGVEIKPPEPQKPQPVMTTDKFGNKFWYLDGKLHREDGPAVEHANGDKVWYKNGLMHREDGPAMEWVNGNKFWFKNGQLHREDGPAIERTDGTKEWWRKGKKVKKPANSKKKKDALSEIWSPGLLKAKAVTSGFDDNFVETELADGLDSVLSYTSEALNEIVPEGLKKMALNKLSGMRFVLTGIRSYQGVDLEALITKYGGSISTSVGSGTTHLVIKDTSAKTLSSTKSQAAFSYPSIKFVLPSKLVAFLNSFDSTAKLEVVKVVNPVAPKFPFSGAAKDLPEIDKKKLQNQIEKILSKPQKALNENEQEDNKTFIVPSKPGGRKIIII